MNTKCYAVGYDLLLKKFTYYPCDTYDDTRKIVNFTVFSVELSLQSAIKKLNELKENK